MMANPPLRLDTDPDQLRSLVSRAAGRVGLDTEFIRERTYWPQLALVQIAIDTPGSGDPLTILADPLAPGVADAVRPLLEDTGIVKVMHSAGEDLVALMRACGTLPQPLFDTQIAAALAGVGAGVGYQRLVKDVTGTELAKGETRSDWLRRPLSPSQLEYAADDVRHLFALHDTLDRQLDQLGRRHWFQEDCARMLALAADSNGERWPHLSMRAAHFLDQPAQRRLLRLLRWREAQARESDRPRSWILDNELATALARDPPASAEALRSLLERQPRAPHRLSARIWEALGTPLADEAEAPPLRGEERDKRVLRKLQDAVAARSAELGLPDGVLASRRWLEALMDGDGWPAALAGWRREQLEPVLAPILAAAGSRDAAPV